MIKNGDNDDQNLKAFFGKPEMIFFFSKVTQDFVKNTESQINFRGLKR